MVLGGGKVRRDVWDQRLVRRVTATLGGVIDAAGKMVDHPGGFRQEANPTGLVRPRG